MSAQSVLYCFTNYPSPTSGEYLDIALTSTVFDQKTTIVFIDEGAHHLLAGLESERPTDFQKSLEGLRLMDEIPIYVSEASINKNEKIFFRLPEFVEIKPDSFISYLLSSTDLSFCF